MRLFPPALAVCLVLPTVVAQQAAAPKPEEKKIRIEGKVMSTAGEPVARATLRLQSTVFQGGQPPVNYTETSTADGKFFLEGVPAGRYVLSAERTGFVTGRYGARSISGTGSQLDLTAGAQMKDVVILLTPQGVIAGKVTDSEGDPVRSVQVSAVRPRYFRGRRTYLPLGSVATDDQGNFRIGGLAPGRYYLSATERRAVYGTEVPGRADGRPAESNVTTYYPSALETDGASAVDVTAGAELAGFNIRLRKARTFTIRGKTATGDAAAPQPVMLAATPSDGNPSLMMMNGIQQSLPDGTFQIRNLAPGKYVIQTLPGALNGNPVSPMAGRVEVTITDADVNDVILPLGPGLEIAGALRLEGGDVKPLLATQGTAGVVPPPLAGAGGGGMQVMGLRPIVGLTPAGMEPFTAPLGQLKEDGTFALKGLAPQKYLLSLNPLPSGTYVKSIRFGNQDAMETPIDLTSGAGGTLDILLSNQAADVSGSIRNEKGEPQLGLTVALWSKKPSPGLSSLGIFSMPTDQSGSFKFTGLAPGEYYVAAWDDPEAGLVQYPDFLARFTSDAAVVKLSESAHESVQAKLVPREKMLAEIAKLP